MTPHFSPSSPPNNTKTATPGSLTGLLAGILLLSGSVTHDALADSTAPASTSGTYLSEEGAAWSAARIGDALSRSPLPDPASALTRGKSDGLQTNSYHDDWYLQEAWITDVGLLLYHDADHDGYFAGFSLSVDADTSDHDRDVYLTIDVRRPFHPVERLHTSLVFPLYGQSAADEYRIDIELLSNYAQDHYELILELRDAYDHQMLERVDSTDFANLRALPLESGDLDNQYHEPDDGLVDPDDLIRNDDIAFEEHAGGIGWWLALPFALTLLARRTSRRIDQVRA